MGPKPRPLAERFFEKVSKTDGCWIWTGAKDKNGYGSISYGSETDGSNCSLLAHRVSLFLATGVMPALPVLHRCDNPACVNPEHLFEGTQQDNIADMVAKGRQNKGAKNGRAMLDDLEVTRIKLRLAGRETKSAIARDFGISRSLVSLISSGKRWSHVAV